MSKKKKRKNKEKDSWKTKLLKSMKTKEFKIFLTFFIIYSLFASYINWNENSRLDLTMAIVDEHRFEIDTYANNTGDRAVYDGHYYTDKAPGMSLLATPLYAVYKIIHGKPDVHQNLMGFNISTDFYMLIFLVTILTSSLFGALSVMLVYKILRYFSKNEKHRLWITIAYGSGTLIIIYSRLFFGHVTATFFAFLSFYLIIISEEEKRNYYFLAGLSAGMAVLVEYTSLLILLGCFVLIIVFKKWKSTINYLFGAFIVLSLLLSYNLIAFDSFFITGYNSKFIDEEIWKEYNPPEKKIEKYMIRDYVFLRKARKNEDESICKLIDSTKFKDICFRRLGIQKGDINLCRQSVNKNDMLFCTGIVLKNKSYCSAIDGLIFKTLCKEGIKNKSPVIDFIYNKCFRLWETRKAVLINLLKILFYPGKGLFFLSPILLFSIIGLYYMFHENKAVSLLIMLLFSAYLFFISTLEMWGGGFSFGVRHMIYILPFLMIPLAYSLKRFGSVLYPYIIISILFTSVGLINHQETTSLSYYAIKENVVLFTDNIKILIFTGPESQLLEKILLNTVDFISYSNMLIILFLFVLIWQKKVSSILKFKRSKLIIISLIGIFLILAGNSYQFIKSKNVYPLVNQLELNGRGWYEKEISDPLRSRQGSSWMSTDASIILYNIKDNLNVIMEIPINNVYSGANRTLTIELNNKFVQTYNIPKQDIYEVELDILSGRNIIRFKTDFCSVEDTGHGIPGRCMSLMFSNPRIK